MGEDHYDQVVKYSCAMGFNLVGASIRMCRAGLQNVLPFAILIGIIIALPAKLEIVLHACMYRIYI